MAMESINMAVEHGCEPGKTLVEHGNENESGGFHGQPRFFMVDHGGSERDGLDGSVWHTGIPSFIIGLRFQPRVFFSGGTLSSSANSCRRTSMLQTEHSES